MTTKTNKKRIYYIDIDGVIFENNYNRMDYYEVTPIKKNIDKINKLYNEGNCIILWTNRGGLTGINWEARTALQLNEHGVKYHKLKMDKPYYDVFIDDRACNNFEDFEKRQCQGSLFPPS